MQVLGNWIHKSRANLQPGELVVFGDGPRQIGICLAHANNGTRFGVIKSTDDPHPRLLFLEGDVDFLSHSHEWLIEPIDGDEVYPGNRNDQPRSGLLVLNEDHWLMNFASSGVDFAGRFNWEWWDLTEVSQADRVPRKAVVFTKWKLWKSAEERADQRAEPLFEYEARTPPRQNSGR